MAQSAIALAKPFVRAGQFTRCALYWLPLAMPEPRGSQRLWYQGFIAELEKRLHEGKKLAPAAFLQFKELSDSRRDHLMRTCTKLMPVTGMSLVPGRPIPQLPSKDEMAAQVEAGDLDMYKLMPGLCYWLLKGRDLKLRLPLYAGGSITQFFLEPGAAGPAMPIPESARKMFPDLDLDAEVEATMKLGHPFQKRSRELFGAPYVNEVSYEGWSFIVPRLTTADFFGLPADDIKNLMSLSPVYLNESPADRGVILAAQEPLEPLLNEIAEALAAQGMNYA